MIVWCGVLDTWTGRIVATSTNKKTGKQGHGFSARKLASQLNRYNAGPDHGGVGGFVQGKPYYRFHSFEFRSVMYFDSHYGYTLKALGGKDSDFKTLAEKAKKVIIKEAAEIKEAARAKELEKINSFDIPEDYKDVLRDYFLND